MERTTESSRPVATRVAKSRRARTLRLGLFALVLALGALLALSGSRQAGAVTTSSFTVHALQWNAADGSNGAPLAEFTYIVNVDNSGDASAATPTDRPSLSPTDSHSPLVATGDQSSPSVTLPDGRYLISIRSPGHKLWGKHITLPQDHGDVNVALRDTPAPLGKLVVQVFEDNQYTNSAPDEGEAGVEGVGNMAGFKVTLTEQTGSNVTVDYYNSQLCGGDCITGPDGTVTITNLSPATYNVFVHAPDGTDWQQTTTLYGGLSLPASVAEGSNGTGLGGEGGWADPGMVTSYWFGFVHTATQFAVPGTGMVTGQALTWKGFPPFDQLVADPNDPVANAFVAFSDATSNVLVDVAQADSQGSFAVTGVPAGTYNVAIFDEQLSFIMRFLSITVNPGQTVDLGEVGVSRWFGWLEGTVYQDDNGNGIYEPDLGEAPLPNFPQDIRWRDGSIAEETVTDANGYYKYPTAEGGYLGKWTINETGFTRMAVTGASVHNELNPSIVTTVPTDLGGALLSNQLITEGHRSIVDWGHKPYADGQAGQIVGITYFATTRNEFHANLQAHENYEAGIPGVEVRLEGLGLDGLPNTSDDVVLNDYFTDQWAQPTNCAYGDMNGNPVPGLNPFIGSLCLEVPIVGNQTKDGAFDGGYAFADYCPESVGGFGHFTDAGDTVCADGSGPVPLIPGRYMTHVVMPQDANGKDLYHIVREEDVNVDLGTDYVPAIPPPGCVGNDHEINQATLTKRSPYFGVSPSPHKPLCDKKLIDLNAKQNANADFFMMTNFDNGPDVAVPGRIVGLVTDNVFFERDVQSIWFGEPRPVSHVPVGIYDYAGRLLTTIQSDDNGSFETMVPSTETYNCPIPQGPCPGMYLVWINDPGSKAHPNANWNPKYLSQKIEWDVWPGQTSQMDIPIMPVAGTGCGLPTGTPELLQLSKVYFRPGDTGLNRRITIQGDFFGASPGAVTINDSLGRAGQATRTLTSGNGGIVSWADRQIVLNFPVSAASFLPGPKQLDVRGANGLTSTNGLTIHNLTDAAAQFGVTYNPTVVTVVPPQTDPHALQNAIDGAAAGSLVVLSPGIYRENVILWKPLKIQGLGVGGMTGSTEAANVPADDPRLNILGTTINGRFFADNAAAWNAKLASLTFSGNQDVSRGADITVVARSTGALAFPAATGLGSARIDGIGITTGRGTKGAGGVEVNAYARSLQLSNNVLESDQGLQGGAINLGLPYVGSQFNTNVSVNHSRVLGSGGASRGGGITIYNGSDSYDIANNSMCANFSNEYGGGISHWGLSPGGSIHDNKIFYNDSVDSGAGISITEEVPQNNPPGALGAGTGTVSIQRNLIQTNMSGDDGGGVFIQNAQQARITLRNNMIVANGAADSGGGIILGNSSNVEIVNNTVADNITTGTYPGITTGKAAGLASHENSPAFQAVVGAAAPHFSNPVVLFNNIFWNNEAFLPDTTVNPIGLTSQGFIDFGVEHAGTFTNDHYNLFTNGNILQPDGSNTTFPASPNAPAFGFPTNPAQHGNIVGVNPMFVTENPPADTATVERSAADPQMFTVTLVPQDVILAGDWHLVRSVASALTSGAIDRGVRCSNYTIPPPAPTLLQPFGPACAAGGFEAPIGANADIDGNARAQILSGRIRTLFDLGADEVLTLG